MNPPMPHPHHAAAGPGERHVVFNNPSGPVNFDHLANQMHQMHIQQDRFSPSSESRSRDFIANTDIDENAGTYYVGYTFFKAPAAPGYQPTWKKVEKTKMNLRQNDLADLVRKGSKKRSVADQYQSLSNVKRPHVDRLVETLRQSNPRFQWICVYVKEDTKEVKGKNYRRGDYETTSMHIILQGKATSRPSSEAPAQVRDQRPVQTQRPGPMPETQHRPFVGNGPYADPRSMPGFPQTPMPSQMHSMQPGPVQPGPAQFHQPGPAPFRPPPQNVMREPPFAEQVNWAQNISRSQPTPAPVIHNPKSHAPAPVTRPDPPGDGAHKIVMEPDRKSHKKEVPHQSAARDPQAKARVKHDKASKQRPESEPDLVYDSDSSDDILTPDQDDDISDEEFSSQEAKSLKTPKPWRGSLYRGHSSSQPRHRRRTHYRKDPTHRKESQQASDHSRGYRRYRDEGAVDIVPADSRHVGRLANRYHGHGRQWAAQPRIVHQQPSNDEMELLMSQVRGRAQNDIRSRMLEDWEADLADREHLFEYQKQMFKDTFRTDRMDDAPMLNRPRALRDPPAYARGFMQRALHY
ncbi:uncharacterized protein DSM5745_10268 [Aspergillus mulundensis]|uniref:Uncharacterized protein n=1 Tax=Aspergillus mulundensis TaxID=1810919 RepID=A0A3D8QMZ2_9EURO|nr:Uncharacterized protein DSM5745_10268 [Aspergillus mulundensis]RDW63157.1 Uncharacterized protein DSM5745_10268 [Aspergillus mulundensis]